MFGEGEGNVPGRYRHSSQVLGRCPLLPRVSLQSFVAGAAELGAGGSSYQECGRVSRRCMDGGGDRLCDLCMPGWSGGGSPSPRLGSAWNSWGLFRVQVVWLPGRGAVTPWCHSASRGLPRNKPGKEDCASVMASAGSWETSKEKGHLSRWARRGLVSPEQTAQHQGNCAIHISQIVAMYPGMPLTPILSHICSRPCTTAAWITQGFLSSGVIETPGAQRPERGPVRCGSQGRLFLTLSTVRPLERETMSGGRPAEEPLMPRIPAFSMQGRWGLCFCKDSDFIPVGPGSFIPRTFFQFQVLRLYQEHTFQEKPSQVVGKNPTFPHP